jgi:hypothetical protein
MKLLNVEQHLEDIILLQLIVEHLDQTHYERELKQADEEYTSHNN